jgi:hypothetical protein
MNINHKELPKGLYFMNFLSKNGLIVCASLMISGIASAAAHNYNDNKTRSVQNTIPHNISYTAHGTTDARTARMFRQLLKNSQALQVTASVKKSKPERDVDVTVNYTIKGKTSLSNVRKLIKLFKTSKHIQVIARANIRSHSAIRGQRFSFNQPGTWTINRSNHAAGHYNRHIAGK